MALGPLGILPRSRRGPSPPEFGPGPGPVSGGVRPWLTGYREPDWLFLLELNWEDAKKDQVNGARVRGTGGRELFLSPGILWTLRNHAIKGGLQLPAAQNRRGDEADTDYRFKNEWEAHFQCDRNDPPYQCFTS